MTRYRLVPAPLLAIAVFSFCRADSVITIKVDVQGAPSTPSFRVPPAGTYTITSSKDKARVDLPDGTALLFDFDKKVVSAIDPDKKSFYQLKLTDYLNLGDKLPSGVSDRFAVHTTVNLEQTVGQDPRPILGFTSQPYNLDLQAALSRNTNRNSGGFGRHRGGGSFPGGGGGGGGAGGGGSFPGSPSGGAQAQLDSSGCKVGGEVWLANTQLGDADRYQLAVVQAGTLLRGQPGLAKLLEKVKHSNQTLLSADFSVSILDWEGQPPQKPPAVSAETISVAPAQTNAGTFTIPSDYTKSPAPGFPLGTAN